MTQLHDMSLFHHVKKEDNKKVNREEFVCENTLRVGVACREQMMEVKFAIVI